MERINLLPPEARVKASRERGLIYAILILVGVVVVLGLVYVWQNSIVSSKQDELAQIQAQQTQVNEQLAALAPYAQIQAERVAMTATGKAHLRCARALVDDPPGSQPRHPCERPTAVADRHCAGPHACGRGGDAGARRRRLPQPMSPSPARPTRTRTWPSS